ncbi:hypothetical protein [Bacillus wiedmannii]|uniref:hypothetical protein n=1 Tax=Bacillus wiedmannii TaxID=1890302 RepID=UPI000BF417C0|nr:hypothetical protein [Bacillus wiedmannii]PFZ93857.1 hypothetical protein COL83_13775 [Bacillus wiedmannii]
MYSMHPYYSKHHTVTGTYSYPNNVLNLETEPRQNGILLKVANNKLTNTVESVPILPESGEITALESYLGFVFLIINDFLIKMRIYPDIQVVKTVRGFRNTKLIAGAFPDRTEGPHIYTITNGKLLKINMDTLEIVKKSRDWGDARLMDAAGPNLYVVVGNDLIKVNAANLEEGPRVRGWNDATLFAVPGDAYIYAIKGDELIRFREGDLQRDPDVEPARGWRRATLMAGTGNRIYIVKDEELSSVIGSTLQSDLNVESSFGWGNATFMSSWGEHIFLITEEANRFKNLEQSYSSYIDYNHYNFQYVLPNAPSYYRSNYYPYYPYYLYYSNY